MRRGQYGGVDTMRWGACEIRFSHHLGYSEVFGVRICKINAVLSSRIIRSLHQGLVRNSNFPPIATPSPSLRFVRAFDRPFLPSFRILHIDRALHVRITAADTAQHGVVCASLGVAALLVAVIVACPNGEASTEV